MGEETDREFAEATLWHDEALALRSVLLEAGLDEVFKWNKPCYASSGENICIIQRMKAHLALMFFKGALMKDPEGLLRDQGANTHSAKRLEFTSTGQVHERASAIKALVAEAIRVEAAGLKVERPEQEAPEELVAALEADPELQEAFDRLTPGRQRSHMLHVGGAKQSATRANRVEKCRPKILAGKGFQER